MLSCGIIGNGLQSSTVAVDRGSTLGHGDSAARISKRSVMKKRTLISTTAGLAVAAMLMGAGFVATANAAEVNSNDITITQPAAVPGQLIQLNSVRTFTINTNVPNYTTDYPNWQAKNFIITDTPSKNIDPFKDGVVRNLVVKATKADGIETTLTKGTHYTVDVTNGTSDVANDFKISLTDPTDWSGQKLTITYDGVITATTPDGTDQTTVNDVQLDFSNNPNVDDEMATLTDQEKLFNAQLDMEKVAFNDVVEKLPGAKFTATVDGAPVTFTKSDDGLTYTVNKDASAAGVTNEVVFSVQGADGVKRPVPLDGLAADTSDPVTYTFTETEAPAGYILGDNPVTFTVTVTPNFDENGESNGVGIKVESDSHANFIDLSEVTPRDAAPENGTVYTLGIARVENTKNINDFAKTGGAIMTMLALAGAATAAGVIAGVAAKRRTNKA